MLRGELPVWPLPQASEAEVTALWDYHGVIGLLHERTQDTAPQTALPNPLRERIAALARSALFDDLLQQREATEIQRAAAARKLRSLILKGTALAFELYSAPGHRPRADLDLLVEAESVAAWQQLFEAQGFELATPYDDPSISCEQNYARRQPPISIDLHWSLNSSPLLTMSAPSFDALWRRSRALPALGGDARGLALADALLLACIHRAGHRHAPYSSGGLSRPGGNRLIWLYDIHLLARALSAAEWTSFAAQVCRMEVRAVCADALDAAARCFRTALPADVMRDLRAARGELSAVFIRGSALSVKLAELRALQTLGRRLRWMRGHLLPPARYMLAKYDRRNALALPWLYLRRIGEGAGKLLRR